MKDIKSFGFDMGANSIGWFAQIMGEDGMPKKILGAGVRIFDNSRDSKSSVPLSVKRRAARAAATRRDRQVMRTKYLCFLLKKFGLLPEVGAESLSTRNPYKLRSLGASRKIDLHGLGRAILHINKRRGFKSNRKADKHSDKDKDEIGGMKSGISKLREMIGGGTLGEFLYERQKRGEGTRMRAQVVKKKNQYEIYADRDMYENEFRRIWATQQKFHKCLTAEMGEAIFGALFFQRPLKVPERGFCQFEDGERRAYKAYPVSQKFRIYQEVNALEIADIGPNALRLMPEDRRKLACALLGNEPKILDKSGNATFAKIKKFLGLPKYTNFNFESEKRKFLKPDTTRAAMSAPENFGDKWDSITDAEREEIAEMLIQNREPEFIKYAAAKFGFDANKSKTILDSAALSFEEGTASLSAKAMRKIMPHLENGMIYSEACAAAGYDFNANYRGEILDLLPYYGKILEKSVIGGDKGKYNPETEPEKYYGKINNPTVHVALNQLRKLVNKLVEVYGKPDRIVIETARDLPLGERGLSELNKEQSANQKDNERIAAKLNELRVANNAKNRMKYKLWEDLSSDITKRCCPFCGKPISEAQLFTNAFEIEHLLPFSETFDDSRANKVVSCMHCNRIKSERTPYEAFSNTGDWGEILARASMLPKNKQWRFKADAYEQFKGVYGDFIARMLNDTRYMSKVAREYLSALVPSQNVITLTGRSTALLRHIWGLDTILSPDHNLSGKSEGFAEEGVQSEALPKDGKKAEKNRGDHRHHAVDAFVISSVNRQIIAAISKAAKLNEQAHLEDILKSLPKPFGAVSFDDVRNAILKINVSHKLDRGDAKKAVAAGKTVAKFHEDTAYGKIEGKSDGDKITIAKRVPISSIDFAEKNISEIANDKIRNDLSDIFGDICSSVLTDKEKENEWKRRLQQYADENKIRRVRIHLKNRELRKLIPVKDKKSGKIYKYMDNAENYCIDIYTPSNSDKWAFEVVSMFAAHQNKMPDWRKNDPHAKLVMRLFKRDCITYEENGEYKLAVITGIAIHGQISIVPLSQAKVEGNPPKKFPSALQKLNVRKVYVDEIGRVYDPLKTRK